MSGSERFDIVILGAGATGLWTAADLIDADARVLIVHAPHEEGYSSTRNQGWLHSGGLYAAFKAPTVAHDCILGSERIRAYAARVDPTLVSDPGFSYVFDTPEQAATAVARCTEMGIAANRCQFGSELQAFFGRPVPAVSVPDLFVDSSRLLRTLGRQLISSGLKVETVVSLLDIQFEFCNEQWTVNGPGFSVSSRAVVIAAGPLIPEIVHKLSASGLDVSTPPLFKVTETTVLCVPKLQLPSSVVCTNGGPHIISYRTGISGGVTICIPFDNQPAAVSSVHHSPDTVARERVMESVAAFMPGLAAVLEKSQAGFWYSCQKLIPTGADVQPDWRHNIFLSVAPGIHIAYAGKFSTAPVLAESVVRQLGGGWQSNSRSPVPSSLVIADQPFRAAERRVR